MSIAALNAKLKKILNGAGGRPSPLGGIAKDLLLGDLLDNIIAAVNAPSVATVAVDTISEKTSAAGVTVDGVLLKDSQVTTDQINEKTSAAGVTVDNCLIKDGRVAALATAAMFASTEQTGTGSEQNVAHGLGAAPSLVLAFFTELDGNAADMAYGTHDGTNCKFTVTSGQKFRVVAFK